MLGLGETHDEIIDTMYDLKDAVSSPAAPELQSRLEKCYQRLTMLCNRQQREITWQHKWRGTELTCISCLEGLLWVPDSSFT